MRRRASILVTAGCVYCAVCQVIIAHAGNDTCAMTPACLTAILDIVLSLFAVGIPERVEVKDEQAHVDVKHAVLSGRSGPGRTSAGGCWASETQLSEGVDTVEGLVLDGTLAVHTPSLFYAPWDVMYHVSPLEPRYPLPLLCCLCLSALLPLCLRMC